MPRRDSSTTVIRKQNVVYVAGNLKKLKWCKRKNKMLEGNKLLLSGCNTGTSKFTNSYPQVLANKLRINVFGTGGYMRGTVFDNNVRISSHYDGETYEASSFTHASGANAWYIFTPNGKGGVPYTGSDITGTLVDYNNPPPSYVDFLDVLFNPFSLFI